MPHRGLHGAPGLRRLAIGLHLRLAAVLRRLSHADGNVAAELEAAASQDREAAARATDVEDCRRLVIVQTGQRKEAVRQRERFRIDDRRRESRVTDQLEPLADHGLGRDDKDPRALVGVGIDVVAEQLEVEIDFADVVRDDLFGLEADGSGEFVVRELGEAEVPDHGHGARQRAGGAVGSRAAFAHGLSQAGRDHRRVHVGILLRPAGLDRDHSGMEQSRSAGPVGHFGDLDRCRADVHPQRS